MNNHRNIRFTPLWMAICVVIGVLIGSFYANHFSGNRLNIINSSGNKLNNLLHIIDDQYVDTVNINDLVEKAMPQILAELDPHSVYITARDGEIANDDLRGCRMSSATVLRKGLVCWQVIRSWRSMTLCLLARRSPMPRRCIA